MDRGDPSAVMNILPGDSLILAHCTVLHSSGFHLAACPEQNVKDVMMI